MKELEPPEIPRRRPLLAGEPAFEKRVRELVHDWGGDASPELVCELVATALKLARDEIPQADMKLFTRAFKEMRYATKVFAPFRDVRKVVVFGSARTSEDAAPFKAAEEFGRRMCESGYMIITGGGDGIMGAAQRGAGRDASFGLNIRLPFEQRANAVISGDPKLVNFNYFFTRKLHFLKEADAVALFPGGFGTLDEGFETLTLMQTGKSQIFPLVLVDTPPGQYWKHWADFARDQLLAGGLISEDDFHLFRRVESVEEAVAEILGFYANYHSSRWVGDRLVIRVQRRLAEGATVQLTSEFADLLRKGEITQGAALPEEGGECADLPRIFLTPHRINLGRIRLLIDRINTAEVA